MSRRAPPPIDGLYSLKVDNISYNTTQADLRRMRTRRCCRHPLKKHFCPTITQDSLAHEHANEPGMSKTKTSKV
ncbi:unnamed protein product [Cylicocyclus nassatus]|uniref:Uncharacterized protein n=1 Tax=Cylicocyclus nassatus TaxID=53992 RepID=A0AA36DP49_CYLNA|nr:unnamed protein product [Cylicocyclus nassatus]